MSRMRVAPVLAVALALATAALLSSAGPATGQVSGGYPILDNFNRADEDPLSGGGNWAQTDLGVWNAMRLGSYAARRSTSGTSASYWTQDSFAGGTGSVWAKWDGIGPYTARVSIALYKDVGGSNAVDGYEFARDRGLFFGNERDYWRIWRFDNGVRSASPLATTAQNPPTAGYRYFNLRRNGDTVEGWVSSDGQTWVLAVSAADSTYTTGTFFASLHINGDQGTVNATLDDFGAAASAEPPGPSAGGSNGTTGSRGTLRKTGQRTRFDPVNTFTGFFIHREQDLETPGTGVSFDWARSYTSGDATVGPLGPGWTHTYAASLQVQGNGDVLARSEEGQELYFTKQADGSFVGDAGALATLTSVAGGYELKRADQVVYAFDTSGRLLSIKDRNDQGVTLAYDGSGRLATVTDAAGKQTTVSYDAQNLVSQVATAGGRSVSYAYTSGRLTSLSDVRGKVWTYAYDAQGRLATIVDPLNHTQVTNVYDANGRVTSQTDAVGKTTAFAWDAATEVATITDANNDVWKDDYDQGVLAKEIDPTNNETLLAHDADLNETAVTSPTSQQTTMTYDAAGNLLTATAPASLGSAQKTFVYNARNDPTQITDARGKVTSYTYTATGDTASVTQDGTPIGSYTYDAAGRVLTFTDGNSKTTTYTYFPTTSYLESTTDPLGNKTTYTYDAAGRVLTHVDPNGNCAGCTPANFTWSYTYDASGNVLTETDPLGKVTAHTYDDAGNELTVTDANSKTTTYTYDNDNRLVSVAAPDGGVTSYTYDNVGNKLTETDPRNNTTTHTYTSANQLASTTTASGAKTTFFYDANGNLVRQVEPRGNVSGADPNDFDTLYTYDAAGRLLTETDPLGNVTTHTYDAVGNELTVTDANSKTTASTYDGKNRLSTMTAADGGVTTYTYDPVGNKLTEKDPRNNTTTFAYDDANRLASVTKPSGGRTTYGYDPNGNQTSMVEPRGNVAGCGCAAQFTWTYAYDRTNRKLSETSPLGHVTTFKYDNVGNRLSLTDAKSRATAYTYDPVNRLETVTAPDLGVTTYTYDLAGNLTQRTDARNNVTTYAYDVDSRRTSVTNPLSKLWTTSYDPAGNVVQTVDANGNATPAGGDGQTTYTYDRAGRLTAIDYSDTTPDVTFTYDAVGNRLTMADSQGTETRTYDPVNRLATVVRGSDTFSYGYDLAGNLTSRTHPGSVQTSYTYDVDSRMASAVNSSLTTSYGYDAAGNLTQTTLPAANGYVETRLYDNAGRLAEVKNQKGTSVLSRFVIARDQVGNPTSVDRTGSLTQVQNYTYDANDRLLTVCYAASCTASSPNRIAWTYDLVGNRLTETRSTGTTNYSYNAGDQLLSAGSTSYTYDSNGNELSAGTRTFVWDLANRLTSTTQGNTTTTYLYDGEGKRLQASTGSAANKKTNFLWDLSHDLPQLALERDGGGALQRQYVYGLGRIRQSAGTPSYFHYDGLGSTVNLTSSSGSTQWTWSYEPYGSVRTETKANGNQPDNFLKFTGEYLDPTGLYHLRARQYDPVIGRFLSVDPLIRFALRDVHQYTYSQNQPTVLTDPSGLYQQPASRAGLAAYQATSPPPPPSVVPGPELFFVDFFKRDWKPLSFGILTGEDLLPLGFTTVSVRFFGHIEGYWYPKSPLSGTRWVMSFGLGWNTRALWDGFRMETTLQYFHGILGERSTRENYCPSRAGQRCFGKVVAYPGELDVLEAVDNEYRFALDPFERVRSVRANVVILGDQGGFGIRNLRPFANVDCGIGPGLCPPS